MRQHCACENPEGKKESTATAMSAHSFPPAPWFSSPLVRKKNDVSCQSRISLAFHDGHAHSVDAKDLCRSRCHWACAPLHGCDLYKAFRIGETQCPVGGRTQRR